MLSERKLSKALNEFVMKDERDAIPELVKWQLRKTQESLSNRKLDETMIDEAISEVKVNKEKMAEPDEDKEIEEVRSFTNNF